MSLRDSYEGIDPAHGPFDRVVLDLPEPWQVVPHAEKAMALGGILVAYTPSITQAAKVREALDSHTWVDIRTLEVLHRTWHIEGQAVRPDHRMVAHTALPDRRQARRPHRPRLTTPSNSGADRPAEGPDRSRERFSVTGRGRGRARSGVVSTIDPPVRRAISSARLNESPASGLAPSHSAAWAQAEARHLQLHQASARAAQRRMEALHRLVGGQADEHAQTLTDEAVGDVQEARQRLARPLLGLGARTARRSPRSPAAPTARRPRRRDGRG